MGVDVMMSLLCRATDFDSYNRLARELRLCCDRVCNAKRNVRKVVTPLLLCAHG